MKLIFKKDEDAEIRVFQKVGGEELDFSYVDMIKALIASKEMTESDILGEFTDAEKKSINSMVTLINKEISVPKESSTSE
ncbi:MAG: hypothetical protein ABII90_09890 [Bacteroidota bacterium]